MRDKFTQKNVNSNKTFLELQTNRVAAFSETTEADRDLFYNVKKINKTKALKWLAKSKVWTFSVQTSRC